MKHLSRSAIRDRLIVHERGLDADETEAAMKDDDGLWSFAIGTA
jgi:hypothetical protein